MSSTVTSKISPALLAETLRSAEPLIGVTAAARLLGIKAPNFKRDAAPHLNAIPVEGSADVYFRSEVAKLAKERLARANGRG